MRQGPVSAGTVGWRVFVLAARALMDVEGFEILSRLRIRFPQTRSFLMDRATLLRWKDSLAISGTD